MAQPAVAGRAATDRGNSEYVENTIWAKAHVLFAALNITGSNNDGVAWGTPLPADAAGYPSQAQEQVAPARANESWLRKAIASATRTHREDRTAKTADASLTVCPDVALPRALAPGLRGGFARHSPPSPRLPALC